MTAQSQLDTYLSEFRRRLKSLIVARGAAIAAIAALLVTLVAVYLGTRRAFDPQFVVGARIVLLLILAAVILALLVYPLRALRRSRGIAEIERRGPEFDGRIETYDGLSHAEPSRRSPFVGLLAEDALSFARRIPVRLRVPSWQISVPALAAVLAAGALIWFAAYGPNNWRYGVRNLWAGWFLSNTLPPQRIDVKPGDGVVRRGGDLLILAQAAGFDPTTMEVYAQFNAKGEWQKAEMAHGNGRDKFGFTFYAIRQPLKYYVSAAGVRSREYGIDVADVPEVTNLKLSYNYPQWSGLEPRVENPGSDIRAVAGTRVTVEVHTDKPLQSPMLVANGTSVKMQTNGNVSTATLDVSKPGQYYVSTLFNKADVKLTDDYLISVVPDKAPVVKVVRPGRDWHATNIEEVPISVEANDDFGLKKVELRYSVNGGQWQTMQLNITGKEGTGKKLFYLENMRAPADVDANAAQGRSPLTLEDLQRLGGASDENGQQDQQQPAPQTKQPAAKRRLEPGDLISYYAVADDRSHSVQSDLYFIQVDPFDRSYTQSTQSGGGGGGGGQQQNQISKRQKEILVATWNLIKQKGEGKSSFLDKQQFQDNAQLLSQLQRTLSEQATSLANRTQARQLTQNDQRIRQFVKYLEQASTVMKPAADRLADLKLSDAVPPEQKALQYLLRAESVFRDIQVSFQRNGGAGGGGLASRDLSELFQMEMDLDKNQYETESPLSFKNTPKAETDKAIEKLQELARRQEALARQTANRRLTEQERWQQDKLRRDTEKLKQQLQQLQQQLARQQQGQQGRSSQGSQSQQASSAGGQLSSTIQQLDQALQAMNRAGASGQQANPQQTQRAIEQARRQLQQALQQMTAQRQAAAEQAFSDLANRSDKLYREQRQTAADLQREVQRQSAANQNNQSSLGGFGSGSPALDRLAQRKDELDSELEALQKDIASVSKQFQNQTPDASQQLNKSLADLQQSQAATRLRYGAEGIREGAAQEVAATDAVTTSALQDLQRGTAQALALAKREAVAGRQPKADPNADLVAQLQALRQQLDQARRGQGNAAPRYDTNGNRQAQGNQRAQGNQQAQAANAQGGGQRAGGVARTGAQRGGGGGGFYNPNYGGVWNPGTAGIWRDPQAVKQLSQQLGSAGNQLLTLANTARTQQALSEEQLQEIRRLADKLRAGLNDKLNAVTLDRESAALVDLVDKVELQLRGAQGANKGVAAAHTAEPAQVSKGFEDLVAEYFRRLGRSTGDKSAP